MSEGADTSRPPKATPGLIVLLGALTAFAALSTDLYLPALPQIARSLRATPAEVELTLASFFVGMALGQLFHGPIADRVGRRPPLLIGVGLFVVASIGCAFAPNIETLIALRVLQALGGCAGVVVTRAVVRDRFEAQETAHVYSLLMLVMGAGPILAPLIGGAILTVAPWPALFLVLAGFGAACWLAAFFRLKETRTEAVAAQARAEAPAKSYWALLRQPRLLGYGLYNGCTSGALLTYITTSPDLLIRNYGVPTQAFGVVLGINALGLIGSSQLNRRVLRRYSYDTILRRANQAAIFFAVLLAVSAFTGAGGLAGILFPLFFIISSVGFSQANALAGAMAVDPSRAGATAALAGAMQFTGGSLAAAAASALHDGTARPMASVVLACLVLGAVLVRTLAPPRKD